MKARASRSAAARRALYGFAALLGDVQAARSGQVAKRLGRRIAGRQSGRQILRRLFS